MLRTTAEPIGTDVTQFAANRSVLLLHDGELADVRELVDGLGALVEDREQAPGGAAYDLVVGTPRRLKSLRRRAVSADTVQMAVLDQDSRTLRAMLRRAGVDLVVRRPVHREALRLLLLHALYRGPERRARRVPIGAPVRFRTGLRRRDAMLADLSVKGCRLLTRRAFEPGQRITVQLPEALSGGRPLSVRGRVVRAGAVEESEPASHALAVAFSGLSPGIRKQLAAIVSSYTEGPAVMRAAPSAPRAEAPAQPAELTAPAAAIDPDGSTDTGYSKAVGSREVLRAPALETDSAPACEAADAGADPAPASGTERRCESRRAYERRVIALGHEAARVLIGRDLSQGGMRVDPSPVLQAGQELRLAIHVSPGETPLVVRARVAHNDGDRGVGLAFVDLSEGAARYLHKMVDFLPVLEPQDEGSEGAGVVVSEILDGAGADREPAAEA